MTNEISCHKFGPDGKEALSWKIGGSDYNSVHVGRKSGAVYIHTNGKIRRFDGEGREQGTAYAVKSDPDFFLFALCEDAEGNLLAIAAGGGKGFAGRILKWDGAGALVKQWDYPASELQSPEGMDVDRRGNLYVCDTYNHRICVFDPDGKLLQSCGKGGAGEAEFRWPQGICVEPEGTAFYVGDTGNGVVKKWSRAAAPEGPPGAR